MITLSESNQSARDYATKLIANSCLIQFKTPLLWAQWCREVARAGHQDDLSSVLRLERERQDSEKAQDEDTRALGQRLELVGAVSSEVNLNRP